MKIIGGRLRGRPLKAPRGRTTRPTAARVREALFSILGNVEGLRVADVCAGTGALGIEALSRGAEHVVFVDADRHAVQTLKNNLDSLGVLDSASVLPLRVERSHRALLDAGPLDLVLCDPPWPEAEPLAQQLGALLKGDLIAPEATVVVGHRAGRPVQLPGFVLRQTRVWGDSALSFFEPDASVAEVGG